jgi:hypothetical protein
LSRSKVTSNCGKIFLKKIEWAGHTERMDDSRIFKKNWKNFWEEKGPWGKPRVRKEGAV